ncbi:MAG: DUF1566 domain-containing protein [Sulfurovum sp.]
MRLLFLIIFIWSTTIYADFSKSGDIVKDNTTNLKWQDSKRVMISKWKHATLYCGELSLNGYKDWRLPTIKELNTLIDDSKAKDTIYSPFIPTSKIYWSATPVQGDRQFSWSVNFSDSLTQNADKTFLHALKCVRGGK